MAVPSRAFVGMVVFGLIASLALVPYTVMVISGYEPPAKSIQDLLREPSEYSAADKAALVIASLFCIGMTWFAWRGLLAAARRDERARQVRRAQAEAEAREGPPPGYQ